MRLRLRSEQVATLFESLTRRDGPAVHSFFADLAPDRKNST